MLSTFHLFLGKCMFSLNKCLFRYSNHLLILSLLSHKILSDSLWPHGLEHARLPCASPSPTACPNSCQFEQSNHLILCCPLLLLPSSFPASGSFQMSRLFASCGQSIGATASASVLPMNMQGWFPLGLTGLISLLSKGLSRVFSSTTVQKHH